MITSYWDLYVAYIDKCVRDNWKNDIDPAHYEMEWNHFLPKCVFGDWPIGQWLTKRQHAIASALQTLAFERKCMFGWHKQYLPEHLLELAWPYFRASSKAVAKRMVNDRVGCHAPEHKGKGGRITSKLKTGIHGRTAEKRSEDARKAGKRTAELGVGVHAMTKEERTEASRKGGKKGVENRSGIHAPENRGKGVKNTNSQVWESTVDGYRSTPGTVARHNKINGWDPNARVRIK